MTDTISGKARELLAALYEAQGNKAAAFTVRSVGAVGTVLETQLSLITAALQGQEVWEALQKARERCRRIRDESIIYSDVPDGYRRGFSAAATACDLFILDLINEIDAPLIAALAHPAPAPEGEEE